MQTEVTKSTGVLEFQREMKIRVLERNEKIGSEILEVLSKIENEARQSSSPGRK